MDYVPLPADLDLVDEVYATEASAANVAPKKTKHNPPPPSPTNLKGTHTIKFHICEKKSSYTKYKQRKNKSQKNLKKPWCPTWEHDKLSATFNACKEKSTILRVPH